MSSASTSAMPQEAQRDDVIFLIVDFRSVSAVCRKREMAEEAAGRANRRCSTKERKITAIDTNANHHIVVSSASLLTVLIVFIIADSRVKKNLTTAKDGSTPYVLLN